MATKPHEDEFNCGLPISCLPNQMNKINFNINDQMTVRIEVIPTWLKNCESPFLWHSQVQRAHSSEYVIERCLEKLEELSSVESEFSLRRYAVILKLVVEYSSSGNKQQVKECIDMLKNCIKTDAKEKHSQFEKLKILFNHIVLSTETHLLALSGQEEQSKELAKGIMPIEEMPNYTTAGLYAIKTNFFLYFGYENAENISVEMARKCLELEPDNDEWMFLLSIALRAQRRSKPSNLEIPREELFLLEKAVEQSGNSKYLQYLAQIYRDSSALAHKQYRTSPGYFTSPLYQTVLDMSNQALCYYKKALEKNPENPANLRKIGYGIMYLPNRIADYDLALKCLEKSLDLSENLVTVHLLGNFYHRFGNDNKKALEYYEKTVKAGYATGLSDFIRVKFIEDPQYDPCEDIENGLKWEIKKKERLYLLTQQGGFYLFIKQDFLKSVDYFNRAIHEDKDSIQITVFKSVFLRMYDTINLYDYLANEALLYLRQCLSSEDKVKALLETITNIRPDLADIVPDPSLITKLCKLSQDILSNDQRIKDKQHNHNLNKNVRDGQGKYTGKGRGGGTSFRKKGKKYKK